MMAEFVVSGTWAELPARIKAKYAGGLLDRISYYFPFIPGKNRPAGRRRWPDFSRTNRTCVA
jgi:hypothetical protein